MGDPVPFGTVIAEKLVHTGNGREVLAKVIDTGTRYLLTTGPRTTVLQSKSRDTLLDYLQRMK